MTIREQYEMGMLTEHDVTRSVVWAFLHGDIDRESANKLLEVGDTEMMLDVFDQAGV